MQPKKKISIIVPLYNEEHNLLVLHRKLSESIVHLESNYSFQFLFVNDGSHDNTSTLISELAIKDSRINFIEFSRNFGKEIATSAGLMHADGDAVLMIDADLQHPVELIESFLKKWSEGYDVIIGVRRGSSGMSLFRRSLSRCFNYFMNVLGETKVEYGSTDFRMLDATVVQAFRQFGQQNRMTRNLIDWMGFKRAYIYFTAAMRAHGKASFSFRALFNLATTTLISNTLLPLRLAGLLGLFITLISGLAGMAILIGKYGFNEPFLSSFSGPAQLAILITFLVGVVLISLGVMALYIAQIHREVMNRPLFIVRRTNLPLVD